MSVTLNITVEDVNSRLAAGQTRIELERSSTVNGSYSLVTNITLVLDDVYYNYLDTGGSINSWYRYRFGVTPQSDYSNPFQVEGASRLKIRQRAIEEYKAGKVMEASDGTATTVTTLDYRARSSVHHAGRGAGTWIYPVEGPQSGNAKEVTSLDTTLGRFTIAPPWSSGPVSGDAFEWHELTTPYDWNLAINRALNRYSYLERVPIVGDGTGRQLLSFLPWLRSGRQVAGVWWTPIGHTTERSFADLGNWWGIVQDQDGLYFLTAPALNESTTVYLEAYRHLDPLYTDESVAPAICQIELAAILAYDEVLADLSTPRMGSQEATRQVFLRQRMMLQPRLARLSDQYAPRARPQRKPLPEAASFAQPFKAR